MEISLKNIWEWISKSIVFVVAVSILFGIGGYVYTQSFVDPAYVASVKFYANGEGSLENNPEFGVAVAPQYAEFLKGPVFHDMVSKELNKKKIHLTPGQISAMIDFTSIVEETSTFSVTVTSSDPDLAYNVALAVAEKAPARVKDIVDEKGKLQVLENPKLPTAPSGASALKVAIVALVLGFVFAAVVVVVKEMVDNRIKSPDEITQLFGIPVFGTVPDFSGSNKKGEK